MSYTICAIPGDGIGQEVVPAAIAVLQAALPGLEIVWAEAGFETFQRTGAALPPGTLQAANTADATLFGAVSSPLQPVPGYRSPILALRRELDLYACVRPVRSLTPAASADLMIVRECTEGLYGGGEESDGRRAVARRVITHAASTRVARLAFELARRDGRRRVTVVHKATVLTKTCGLFRDAALQVAQEYPEIAVEEMLVDNAALQLATQPRRFEVVVTSNLFGDILSDVAAMHCGGLGLAPSANLGDRAAVFEPVHGSAPDIAGQGSANPLAAILAGAMLLDHLGEARAAGRVREAVVRVANGPLRTPDLGGDASTEQVVRAVLRTLGEVEGEREVRGRNSRSFTKFMKDPIRVARGGTGAPPPRETPCPPLFPCGAEGRIQETG